MELQLGIATRIPPHNLTEVEAINLHVKTIIEEGVNDYNVPDISIEQYMEHILSPDFPTGADSGVDGIYDIF